MKDCQIKRLSVLEAHPEARAEYAVNNLCVFCIVNTCFIWRLISILRFAVFILNFIPKPIRRISLTPEFTTQLHCESCLDSVLIKTFSVFFY